MKREDFVTTYARGHNGDNLSNENKLATLAGFCFAALSLKGEDTAATIEAIAAPADGVVYRVSAAGTLNVGANELAVVVGDIVRYDGDAGEWVKEVNVA